ncbi:MAG: DedA family protein [Nitrospinota bacterium]
MEEWLIRYGYLFIFFGTFVEGETVLVLAGFLAFRGYWPLAAAVFFGALGAFTGYLTLYALGRWQGERVLARLHALRRHRPRLQRLLQRYGFLSIFVAQFLYGARLASALCFGLLGFPPARFVLYEAVACALWASLMGGAGYVFGEAMRAFLGRLGRYELPLAIILVAAGALYHLAALWRRRRLGT